MADSTMICGHLVDVGDRYEVIQPCLLWKDHEGHHIPGSASSGAMTALGKWQARVDTAESKLEDAEEKFGKLQRVIQANYDLMPEMVLQTWRETK